MTEEDRVKHDAFCGRIMAELAPVGEMETFFASSIAEEACRLNYSRALANNIVASPANFDRKAPPQCDDGRQATLLPCG
jgi:hypothetical protein